MNPLKLVAFFLMLVSCQLGNQDAYTGQNHMDDARRSAARKDFRSAVKSWRQASESNMLFDYVDYFEFAESLSLSGDKDSAILILNRGIQSVDKPAFKTELAQGLIPIHLSRGETSMARGLCEKYLRTETFYYHQFRAISFLLDSKCQDSCVEMNKLLQWSSENTDDEYQGTINSLLEEFRRDCSTAAEICL